MRRKSDETYEQEFSDNPGHIRLSMCRGGRVTAIALTFVVALRFLITCLSQVWEEFWNHQPIFKETEIGILS